MKQKIGVGTAHGKIILIGEHSVVYNQPAIAIPFKEVKVITTITESDQLSVDCLYHQGALEDGPAALNNLKVVVNEVCRRLNQPTTFHIHIASTIPQERGMGSSAAVANATIAAIYDYFQVALDDATRFELVQISETIAHGNPSGLDAKVTISNQPIYFIKNERLEPFDINYRGYLVIADTGQKGQTLKAVSALKVKKNNDPHRVNQLITNQGQLSNSVKEALSNNDAISLGYYLDQAHSNLVDMGVSSYSLNHLVSVAKQWGALGCKLTGGGWGGCMFALVDDIIKAQSLQEILVANKATQTWVLAL